MKILYIHQYFKTPAMAGGTRSYEMARRMVGAGHRVTMVTSRSSGERLVVRDALDDIDIVWIRVRYENSMTYPRRLVAFFLFGVLATYVSLRNRGDVIFATSTPLTVIVPAALARLWHRTPVVFEVRDLWPEVPIALGALRGRIPIALARWMEAAAYRMSVSVVALSDGMKDGVLARGVEASKVHVVPNSCDRELFDVPDSLGEAFRSSRPWLRDRPLIVYAGTIGLVNGLEYMVELAAAIKETAPDVRLLAIGSGRERERIERLAARAGVLGENLFFEDAVPKSEMPAVLNAADVCASFVLPIRALEANSANKFFDSLAAGRPIVINYGGWQAELIRASGCGLVLPERATEGAVELLAFLRSSEQGDSASASCQYLAASEFDRDLLASKLIRILESAAKLATRRP